jgi:hypothetical protein
MNVGLKIQEGAKMLFLATQNLGYIYTCIKALICNNITVEFIQLEVINVFWF